MAREMFNPNFSLFVPMPAGGATFQPNPNSVVQNDEARGTNHLDFFRFVGRVVGKALADGQHIDAYFTRSFYKHCLGQPLTYQARAALCRARMHAGCRGRNTAFLCLLAGPRALSFCRACIHARLLQTQRFCLAGWPHALSALPRLHACMHAGCCRRQAIYLLIFHGLSLDMI
jgi:hypothetical protein